MSTCAVTLLFTLLQVLNSITFNRDIYNNYRGNINHDGFMIFPNYSGSTAIQYKWSNNYSAQGYCVNGSPYPTLTFSYNTIYCITNSFVNPLSGLNESVIAINPKNGDIIWQKYILHNSEDEYNNFIDAKNNGNILFNITLHGTSKTYCDSISNPMPCVYSYILGLDNGLFSWYRGIQGYNVNSSVFSYNFMNGSSDKNNFMNDPNLWQSILSLCGNDNNVLISIDQMSFIHGYSVDNELNIINLLWNQSITDNDSIYQIPPVCIKFGSKSQVLFGKQYKNNKMTSVLVDVETGNILNDNIIWNYTKPLSPVIHYFQDIISLIWTDGNNTVSYQINDNGYNEWKILWKYINKNSFIINDLLIVNDLLYLSHNQGIDIVDIFSGNLKYNVSFDANDNIIGSRLIAGKDDMNNVWVVAHCYITPYQTILYAFS
eukprot:332195_1